MNRGIPIFVLVFALAFFFVSERVNLLPSIDPDSRTVVSFWAFTFPAQTMRQLKTSFEDRHPELRVEVQTVSWDNLQEKTLWAVAANSNVPDVIVGSSEWVGGLANAGALEPLDGEHLSQDFFDRYFPATLGVYQFPEVRRDKPGVRGPLRQYGIPLDLDLMMIFYRADVLEPVIASIGMEDFPEDWDGFLRLGTAVNELVPGGGAAVHLMHLDPDDPVPLSMAFLPASGASFLDDKFSRAVFDSPEAVSAFEFFHRLLKENCAIRWERATMEDPMILYKTGRALANISGPWYSKYLERKAPELSGKWKVALFPRRAPGLPPGGLGGACLAVPFNAPHKKEAIELIRFMATDAFALAYFNRVGSPPPQVTAWNDPVFEQPVPYFGGQQIYHVVRQAIEGARPLQLIPNTEITKGPVRQALREAAAGANVQATLNRAVEKANAILKER
jgi:ABC-type glycerol-3-phosphate transport system substrate-binding protein